MPPNKMNKIVITGASRANGIGFAIARRFLARDAKTSHLILCARTRSALEDRARELRDAFPGSKVDFMDVDLSDAANSAEFARFCERTGNKGAVQLLINNSGFYRGGTISDEPAGTLTEMLSANLFGAYHLTRALLPAMKEQSSGTIINIASVASLRAFSNGGSYSIAKHALKGFSMNLREELREYGIKVTAVYPGATATDHAPEASKERLMGPEDVAEIVVAITELSPGAVVEEVTMRPQLGDL